MDTLSNSNKEALNWLLDPAEPGVRYLALRDLAQCAPDDPELIQARKVAHKHGQIAAILDAMQTKGYWVESGSGYNPKYRSTVWAIILLAQLGASASEDERIARACSYLMDHGLMPGGQFTSSGQPSGAIDCLQGNLCWALTALDFHDPRLGQAFEWMARMEVGEGVATATDRNAPLRYYAAKCGPVFRCGANLQHSCAWGASKVMLAFSLLPPADRTPIIERAINLGIDFLFSVHLTEANWPSGDNDHPSRNWWKFGFPVFYVTDLLQIAEGLVGLGCGNDPRIGGLLTLIQAKQNPSGQWNLEYDYTGKTWVDFGEKGQSSKWVTLRALRVLKKAGSTST